MAIIGSLLKKGIRLGSIVVTRNKINSEKLQRKTLSKLLGKAQDTAFGQAFHFSDILTTLSDKNRNSYYELYKKNIPVYDYNKMYTEWWHKNIDGEKNVAWPGKVKYYALSSGTSESASKRIPVTKAMSKAIQKTSIKQILALGQYKDLPANLYEKGYMMLGGSTQLTPVGDHFEGDLSGITQSQIPFWFEPFYKPGKEIASQRDWETRLQKITEKAKDWDIGFIVGVPAWLQLLMERVIEHYQVENIHQVWPNLRVFGHGGVSFEPYKKGFEKLLGQPLYYIETYLASEGFLAYQTHPDAKGMQLVLDNGIFFEFVPFDDTNFDQDGNIVANPEAMMMQDTEEGKDYAILISTCSGAWRYLIGDTVKFVDKSRGEIVITGRTKHFLSLCGEHLSVDNMNKAIELVSQDFGISVKEFTVIGQKSGDSFKHHWFIGTDDQIDQEVLQKGIDDHLKVLNDDYIVERRHALKDVVVTTLPTDEFYKWMESKGKMGGQHKFPRVLKGNLISEWETFLQNKGYQI